MLTFLVMLVVGGNMASNIVSFAGVDQVFRIGPEDLVAQSPTIVAGPVSRYSQKVLKYSQPGPDGFPLEWIVSGELDQMHTLKGQTPLGPVKFSRPERSPLMPVDLTAPYWEREFGNLEPEGQVVLFLGKGEPPPILKVLPSARGEEDLVSLVREIVQIQAVRDPAEQYRRWLHYLTSASSDEAGRVALRSLARSGADWNQLVPALRTLFEEPRVSGNLCSFAFGFVAFRIANEEWGKQADAAAEFLCGVFSRERDSEALLDYMQSFKLVLAYATEEPLQSSRQPLRERVLGCLHRRASQGPWDPELDEEYKQIRADYGTP